MHCRRHLKPLLGRTCGGVVRLLSPLLLERRFSVSKYAIPRIYPIHKDNIPPVSFYLAQSGVTEEKVWDCNLRSSLLIQLHHAKIQ